jgi:bifunctional non-homologous end joining protein LigD
MTEKGDETKTIRMGRISIESDNRDKVFYPDAGITKGEVVDYYRYVAPTMLPYLTDRAVSMRRFPDGIDGDGFYQKEAPDYFPDWITTETLDNRQGGSTTYVVADRGATLVYLADQGTITPHVWLSRIDRPDHPDRMIFDLDPPDGGFELVRTAARALRDALGSLDVPCFAMTTGSRGLHVVVPLDRTADFDEVREYASRVAELAALRHPDELTTEQRKDKRRGRLFLDILRNAYGQTAVPPYALRARPGAPVAAPIEWGELGSSRLRPDRYTIKTIFRRLGQKDDPWEGMGRHGVSIATSRDALRELLEKERGDAS